MAKLCSLCTEKTCGQPLPREHSNSIWCLQSSLHGRWMVLSYLHVWLVLVSQVKWTEVTSGCSVFGVSCMVSIFPSFLLWCIYVSQPPKPLSFSRCRVQILRHLYTTANYYLWLFVFTLLDLLCEISFENLVDILVASVSRHILCHFDWVSEDRKPKDATYPLNVDNFFFLSERWSQADYTSTSDALRAQASLAAVGDLVTLTRVSRIMNVIGRDRRAVSLLFTSGWAPLSLFMSYLISLVSAHVLGTRSVPSFPSSLTLWCRLEDKQELNSLVRFWADGSHQSRPLPTFHTTSCHLICYNMADSISHAISLMSAEGF